MTLLVREATEPPEARGITRDAVRMMVAYRSDLRIVHTHAHDLPQFLDEGDLVVVNTSGTLAAALDVLGEDGTPLVVHLSQRLPADLWMVELRQPNGGATVPWEGDPPGHELQLVGGGTIELATRYEASTRLWIATLHLPAPLLTYLTLHGRPIRYGYVSHSRVNETRRSGGRVIAIGTTVVRALESSVDRNGTVHPSEGWTDVVVTPERGVRAIDGMLTGWHEPEASHLQMLEAVAGRQLIDVTYAAATEEGYLWHEFGDVELVLP